MCVKCYNFTLSGTHFLYLFMLTFNEIPPLLNRYPFPNDVPLFNKGGNLVRNIRIYAVPWLCRGNSEMVTRESEISIRAGY